MTERDGAELSASRPTGAQGPGAQLRKIREAKRISLDDMAKQLRFTPHRLAQLENDDYSTMGSSTFARGYLRTYARLLGMPENEVVETVQLFDTQDLQTGIRSNVPHLIHEKMAHTNHRAMRGFGLLVVLILVILAGFWWHNRNPNAERIEPGQEGGAAAQPDANAANPPVSEGTAAQPIPLQSTPATDTNAAATPATTQQQPAAAAASATQPTDNPRRRGSRSSSNDE